MVRVLASSVGPRPQVEAPPRAVVELRSAVEQATASGVRTLHFGRALSEQVARHSELRARMVRALSGESKQCSVGIDAIGRIVHGPNPEVSAVALSVTKKSVRQ
jgi:hypothetical protein